MRHLPYSAMCALNHTGRMYGRAGAAAIDWTTISLSQRSSSGHQCCNILNLVRGKLFDIDGLILTKCHGLKWHGVFFWFFLFICLFYPKHTFSARGGGETGCLKKWSDTRKWFQKESSSKITNTSFHSWHCWRWSIWAWIQYSGHFIDGKQSFLLRWTWMK